MPRGTNERSASASLKTLATAQADFRANDRDNDGIQNFWVRDVFGLFALCPLRGPVDPDHMIQLIEPSQACADATTPAAWGNEVDPARAIGAYAPKAGYVYRVMTHDASGRPYDDGTGRNPTRFALCHYPVGSAKERQQTFIMDESIMIWRKATNGVPVLRWPADLGAEGWTKLD
jgi:hypothetical protein